MHPLPPPYIRTTTTMATGDDDIDRRPTTTTMATGDDDNDIDGDSAMGNEVEDDGNGATGDDDDDGDGDGAMGSSATGYNDDNDGDGRQR